MYLNYHKHTHYSSIVTPDTHVQIKEYFDRMLELGHNIYFTTEHGYAGSIFEPFEIREEDDKYKDIKICYGVEAYITAYPEEKINDNYHIIILARTDDARKKINKIISKANKENFYYKGRLTLEDVLTLDKDEVYITTACVAGLLKDDDSTSKLAIPIMKHFKENFFLEVQNHNQDIQKKLNKKALLMADKYGCKIVHANDSHYIYPTEHVKRLSYLKGKGITYYDEDTFILDYPSKEDIKKRYKVQGVLGEKQIDDAINNTLIFSDCEEIQIDKEIKMPPIYPELTLDERMEKLEGLVYEKWEEEKQNVNVWDIPDYEEGIRLELDIIRKTNDVVHTADYFLLNHKIIKRGQELGGVISLTSRGSAGSFIINKLLGLIGIDRFYLNVPMYPTRFMSKSRLLEAKSLPDIDINLTEQEPFVQAAKEILGENSCYQMLAYGTMQLSESFRNYCRTITTLAKEENSNDEIVSTNATNSLVTIAERLVIPIQGLRSMEYDDYNDVAKSMDDYVDDPFWGKLIKEAEGFVGSIVSSSPSPASFLLMDKNIDEEIGVIKVGDKFCAIITSNEVENWKYLKDDFLITDVTRINSNVFKEIGIEPYTNKELISKLDDKVWKLYENGITSTLNQADSDYARGLIMRYRPTTYEEMSMFVAAIRPGFASLLENFITRQPYSTGVDELDEILEDSNHYMLYQESIMKYLMWLGIEEDKTYGLIKKISKKTLTGEELESLHEKLEKNWVEKVGTLEGFEETWQSVEDASKYAFNASHSIAVALDSLYGAYLKSHYPLEYYTVAMNEYLDDSSKIEALTSEISYFGITLSPAKFINPSNKYSYDKETKTIYQGISSIKFISYDLGEKIKGISKNDYKYFTDLLFDLTGVGANTREIEILIKINFFSDLFPSINKCLAIFENYKKYSQKKTFKKENISEEFLEVLLTNEEELSLKITDKQIRTQDMQSCLRMLEPLTDYEEDTIEEIIQYQGECLGYLTYSNPEIPKNYILVTNLNTKYSPTFVGYCLNNGKSTRLKIYKNKNYRAKGYNEEPFKDGDMLDISKYEQKNKSRYVDGEWIESDPPEYEWWVIDYKIK